MLQATNARHCPENTLAIRRASISSSPRGGRKPPPVLSKKSPLRISRESSCSSARRSLAPGSSLGRKESRHYFAGFARHSDALVGLAPRQVHVDDYPGDFSEVTLHTSLRLKGLAVWEQQRFSLGPSALLRQRDS